MKELVTSSEASEVEIIKMLTDFAQQLFGYNPANIPTGLISASIQAICERFPGITLNDIQQAFRTQEIEKKGFTALSRDEFLEPIKQYWKNKCLIVAEIKEQERRQNEADELRQRAVDFKKECEDIYRKSLDSNEWLGDSFNAMHLARDFAERMKQERKNELWKIAGREWKEAKKLQRVQMEQAEQSGQAITGLVPVPPPDNFYAMEIMREAVKKKMLIQVP